MQDDLTKLIESNREAFDVKIPRDKVWQNIRALLSTKSIWGNNSLRYWQVAAVLLLTINLGFLYRYFSERDIHSNVADFKNTEAFYQSMIADKMDIIQANQSDLNGFTSDFQQLEAMYAVLQEEFQNRPSEKVKDAMILNLLVRINLLNKQLQEVEEKENEKTKVKDDERHS
jgi:hypothetical protein